ncbi:peptidylprolyl isomerase [Gaetbulibacter aestuarii]|uniref:Peptidylprolyl isomerase n=1 Tax=Gaetbulibacter aestuarii TaxID=1502358 RepID=A0ABW7MZ94_9FLAO
MSVRLFFVLIFSVFFFSATAQVSNEAILFTIDSTPVKASEFIRLYNKNLNLVQDESEKEVENYLQRFIDYKLKLQEAKTEGLDKKTSYLRELRTYTEQLAKNYITDSKVTDALVKEAYDRVSQEVNVDHILVRLAEDASPQDTLAAYNKIMDIRDRTLKEGFDKVRKEVHNGKTIYGEALGYFSGFKMVYPFETVAYNTPVGNISQPFRTQFGYHILKVLDKRPARGKVTVAHIMLLTKDNDSVSAVQELKINDIYKKLTNGASFDALAKQYSEDKNTAANGGKLAEFTSGQLSVPKFEDAAFALKNPGDISEPVKSKFGWHIIKLIRKEPVEPFESMKPELVEKIKRDSRSKLIDDALYAKLRKQYDVDNNPVAVQYFSKLIKPSNSKKVVLPDNYIKVKPLFTLGDRTYTYRDFGMYLETYALIPENTQDATPFIQEFYDKFLNTKLVAYHKSNLEHINPEYAAILQEYRDGLLLFDLMDKKIWNLSSSDSTEMKAYYEKHLDKYRTPEQIDATMAQSTNTTVLKKVVRLWKSGMDLEHVKALTSNPNTPDVIFKTGLFSKDDPIFPENLKMNPGISKIFKKDESFFIFKINEVKPETQKPFDEVRGLVQSDFQAVKEKEWLESLKKKYKVSINQDVLQAVKTQLQSQ